MQSKKDFFSQGIELVNAVDGMASTSPNIKAHHSEILKRISEEYDLNFIDIENTNEEAEKSKNDVMSVLQ